MTPDRSTAVAISVIVASVEAARTMRRCLESVCEAAKAVAAEVMVVDASRDGSADIAEEVLGPASVIRLPVGTLTPDLWAAGIQRSRGKIVALTTAHFEVQASWLDSLAKGLDGSTLGASGRIDLADETSVTDWAVFYLRYAEFLNEPENLVRGVSGIPADNAAYDGDAARQFVARRAGFWEVEFHQELHAAGRSLALVRNATARYGRSFPFLTIAAHRFHHGRHAGAWRVATGQRSLGLLIASAPAVPFALAARSWRRVRSIPAHRSRFLRALPVVLALATMWAAGEAVGAMTGAPLSRRPAPVPA